jgi:hypothetical protein
MPHLHVNITDTALAVFAGGALIHSAKQKDCGCPFDGALVQSGMAEIRSFVAGDDFDQGMLEGFVLIDSGWEVFDPAGDDIKLERV